MVLLRRVIGDALRARRQGQHRTLREVSTAANVSLGYLSEIERGQKEASSELLASICDALGARLSEVLRDVSDTVAVAEQVEGVLADQAAPVATPAPGAPVPAAAAAKAEQVWATDGPVSVTVR
uniref:helix-turn-helix domain-containing protein n=1 Tax=Allorhizocola rhizosphaerae TaxID=1872709 RepID=UPI0013C2C3DC